MQSEDFLNLFTLNSLTPRNIPAHQQTVTPHQQGVGTHQQTVGPHHSPNQPSRAQGDNNHNNADIIKRINILLGESLDINNLNFSMPIYTHTGDANMNALGSQNSFTGNDLITNYPTLAGISAGVNAGRSLDFIQNGNDLASGGASTRTQEQRNTPIKPVRAIRGDQYYTSSTPADERMMKSDRSPLCSLPNRVPIARTSLFDDPAAHYNLHQADRAGPLPMGMQQKNRSPFTDSDTSGISSDTSAISESYLLDLMNSLTITPPSTGNIGINNDFFRHQNLLPNNWANGDVGGAFRFSDAGTTMVSPKLLSKPKIADVGHLFMTDCSDPNSIERAARLYRSAASICEATCTWSGQLPLRINQREPIFSCKVFLGGIPWDITEAGLERCFKPFGRVRVEWPGKDGKHPRFGSKDIRGYAYLLFENDKCVRALLDNCSRDVLGGEYYYKVPSKRLPGKKVQVIPWILSDSNYVCQLTDRLDTNKTVFVGALHGMINAEALATIMNDLFGDVIYAGIDLDKHKYPIGSGRVTFSTMRSYMKAVCAAFVEVKTLKFTKTIQIDPYLEEDTLCQHCNYQKGRFFCRDQQCFRYYCQACWQWQHTSDLLSHHKPLTRYKKNNGKEQQNLQ